MRFMVLLFALSALPLCFASAHLGHEIMVYQGACDASGGVAVGKSWFAMANDEDNTIRVYPAGRGGEPSWSYDLDHFLEVDDKYPESDLEAGTRLGDLVYWISSNGRNRSGKFRESRCRLFAVRLDIADGRVVLEPRGKPYRELIEDFKADPRLRALGLAEASLLRPKARGGLNIEGLCGTPDGRLLLGFRNPLPHRKALLVPLLNPLPVILGKERARFGAPVLLHLGGLGIRDIAFVDGEYLILGGPRDGEGACELFIWKGENQKPERVKRVSFAGLTPEAIIVYPELGSRRVQILSDDGTKRVNGIDCKKLPPAQRTFRSVWIKLPR